LVLACAYCAALLRAHEVPAGVMSLLFSPPLSSLAPRGTESVIFLCSESICFPAISCGVRGCPHELGAQIALRTIASSLREQFSITNDFSHQDPRSGHGSIGSWGGGQGEGVGEEGGGWRGWGKDRPPVLSSLKLVE
jgi:hypothetical protein